MQGMEDLYREVILDHYQSPRQKGLLDSASVIADGKNPLCGDELTIYLQIENDAVKNVTWDGLGCSICMASASMLAEHIKGKSAQEAKSAIVSVVAMLQDKGIDTSIEMSDITVLEGVKKFPVRIKCALLAWTTLQEGLKTYERDNKGQQHASFTY